MNAVALRYRKFAQEFFVDCDATAAYARVYRIPHGKAAEAHASRLIRHKQVRRFLAEEFARLQARLELQQDRATLETCRLAYSDIATLCSWGPEGVVFKPSDEVSADARAAIQEIHSTRRVRRWVNDEGREVEETDTHLRVRLHAKMPALSHLHTMFAKGLQPMNIDAIVDTILTVAEGYVGRAEYPALVADVQAALRAGATPDEVAALDDA
jgi:phage terminase small subunit